MHEVERRTVAGWAHHLEAPDERLTLDEFIALCLLHIREHVKDSRYASEHVEGMIGTLDEMLATGDPMYAAIAEKRGRRTAGMVPLPVGPGGPG